MWIYDSEDGGALKGMGGVLIRDGFLDGEKRKVGYLGDLRTRGFLRERLAFPHVYGHIFQRTVDETGCDAFLTGVLADNEKALRALANTKSTRHAQPHYHLLRRFDMVNLHFLRRRRFRTPPGLTIRRATLDDIAGITALLARDHEQRPFGWRFDDGEFEHRLASWPGFSLDDTFVVYDDQGTLRATTTCWDAAPVKRYTVVRYGGEMVWVKRAMSFAAKLTGMAPLPQVGAPLRYRYLTNCTVKNDDPVVFEALLQALYMHYQESELHFLAFPLYHDDALAPAVARMFTRRIPFLLYAVTSSKVARTDWQAGRPGFEMALA